eukprot:358374-Chlamydomonas_euryale.AAC.12
MASIRSLVIRHAAVIVREVYLPAADAPSSGGGGGAAVGSAVVRAHPFMRTAVNVAEMLARHHLGEGKATRTLAGECPCGGTHAGGHSLRLCRAGAGAVVALQSGSRRLCRVGAGAFVALQSCIVAASAGWVL